MWYFANGWVASQGYLGALLSNSVNNLCLASIFSTIASITRSESKTASPGLTVVLIRDIVSVRNFSPACKIWESTGHF